MSSNSPSRTFYAPTLQIDVPDDTTCLRAMCPQAKPNATSCQYAPRYAEEVVIAFTVKSGKCKEGQYSVSPTPEGGLSFGYDPYKYPTVCTFSDQACAELVCEQVQTGSINATDDGKSWTCFSDSSIAKAAGEGTYWFANRTNPCKDTTPTCKDLKGRSYNDIHPVTSDFTSGTRPTTIPGPLLLFGISSAAVALLGLVA